jgi:hypothetical protein
VNICFRPGGSAGAVVAPTWRLNADEKTGSPAGTSVPGEASVEGVNRESDMMK